jgi:L-ascorbate metabolism protein UlaG (beta-lactamase superfamily)
MLRLLAEQSNLSKALTNTPLPTFPQLITSSFSHDHYDHVDFETLVALKDKIKTVICGLGVGAHLEHWGYLNSNIVEMDWQKRQCLTRIL